MQIDGAATYPTKKQASFFLIQMKILIHVGGYQIRRNPTKVYKEEEMTPILYATTFKSRELILHEILYLNTDQ